MPQHYEVGLCRCWEPTCAAGECAELSYAAVCGALRQGRAAQSPGRTVCLHGKVSLHSRVSLV